MDSPTPDNVFPLPVPLLKPEEVMPRSADQLRARGAMGTGGSTTCTATAKSTGQRCTLKAVTGSTVCHTHGAARGTPARRVADEILEKKDLAARIAEAADAALDTVLSLAKDASDDKTQLAAAKDILDRAGHGAVKKSEIGGPGAFALLDVDSQIERMLSEGRSEEAG